MNPPVAPGDTIRAVRMEDYGTPRQCPWTEGLQRAYQGQLGTVIHGPDQDGDLDVEFPFDYEGYNRGYVSAWELP